MVKSVEKRTLRKGPWSREEDHKLIGYINRYGIWNWTKMAKPAGLQRSGKSCRLRWMNYLRPGIKHGNFTREEVETIIDLHQRLGNRWSVIASRLPGRTDNEIKNYWHTHLSKGLNHNSMPKTEPFQFQISNVETELKSSSEIDLASADAPKALNSDSSGAIFQLSPQFSTESLPSSSSNPAPKIDKNQTVCSSEIFGEPQTILEQQLIMQSGESETSCAEPEVSAAISQLAWFQYPGNSCNDVWLNFQMKGNIYGG